MYNAYGGSARASGAQTALAGARSGAASRTAARTLPAFSVAFVPPNAVLDTGGGGGSAADYDDDGADEYAYADEHDGEHGAYGVSGGGHDELAVQRRAGAQAWRNTVGRVTAPPPPPAGVAGANSAAPTAAALPAFSTSAPLGFSSAQAAAVPGAPVDADAASSALGVSEREMALLEALRIARDKYRGARKMLREQGGGAAAGDAALGRPAKPDASGPDPANAKNDPLLKMLGMRNFRKIRQDRDALRRYELGRALIQSDDNDDDVAARDESMTPCAARLAACRKCWSGALALVPLRGDVYSVASRYGIGVGTFFQFLRYHFLTIVPLTLGWLVVLITHFASTTVTGFNSFLPAVFRVSSFPASVAFMFTTMCLVFVPYVDAVFAWLLWREDLATRRQALLEPGAEEGQIKYARTVLNLWDFSRAGRSMVEETRLRVAESLRGVVAEENRRRLIASMTRAQRVRLTLRRVLGFFALAIVLAGGWTSIMMLQLYEQYILIYLSIPVTLRSAIVPLGLTLVNGVGPVFIRALVTLQNWHDPSTRVKITIVTMYLLRVLNLLVLMMTYAPLLLTTVNFPFSFTEDQTTACAVDQAGEQMFTLFLVDAASYNAVPFALVLVRRLVGLFITRFRTIEFDTSTNVVSLIYSQALLWLTIPYYPAVLLFAPFTTFASFKWTKLVLNVFMTPGTDVWTAKDTGRFFLVFSVLNIVLSTVNLYAYAVVMVVPADCGPHSGNTPASFVTSTIAQATWSQIVYDVFSNGWIVYGAMFIMILYFLVQRNVVSTLSIFVLDQRQHFDLELKQCRRQLKKASERAQETQLRLAQAQQQLQHMGVGVTHDGGTGSSIGAATRHGSGGAAGAHAPRAAAAAFTHGGDGDAGAGPSSRKPSLTGANAVTPRALANAGALGKHGASSGAALDSQPDLQVAVPQPRAPTPMNAASASALVSQRNMSIASARSGAAPATLRSNTLPTARPPDDASA